MSQTEPIITSEWESEQREFRQDARLVMEHAKSNTGLNYNSRTRLVSAADYRYGRERGWIDKHGNLTERFGVDLERWLERQVGNAVDRE